MASLPERIRHRIKEIELQSNVELSRYPISLKVFVDDKKVCELPPIQPDQPLKWSRPIICRDVALRSQLSLEITEVRRFRDEHHRSETYQISDIRYQTEMRLAFPGAQWTASISLLVPETADHSYFEAQRQLTQTTLAPGTLDRLGKAQGVLWTMLDFGNVVAEAHPAAKMVFSLCTVVWDKLKEKQQLGKDTQDLIDGLCHGGGIFDLAKVARGYTKPRLQQLKNTIDAILILLEDMLVYILERESRGGHQVTQRLLSSDDRETVVRLSGRLKTLRTNFDSELAIDTRMVVYSVGHEAALDRLKPVDPSSFDLDNQGCQDGTRKDLITNILDWVHGSPSTNSGSNTVLWVYGQAGIGKSAIAASLYKWLFKEGQLAAGFFCKYDDPGLQQPLGVINTIAYGLARCNKAYGDALVATIKTNRNLCAAPSMQLRYEGLIKKPLARLWSQLQPRPLVILVDALDECGTTETRGSLIRYLWDISQIVPWLKVVVTSRPDADIRGEIEKIDHILTSRCNVHDFQASDDIYAYFEEELGDLAQRDGWPEGSIEQLRDKAGGLFIWASTAKRFITDTQGSTKASLRIVLEGRGLDHIDPLDLLYTQVIQNGMKDDCNDNKQTFRRCIGAIVAVSAHQPLSLPELCSLLQGEVGGTELRTVVDRLHSMLHSDDKMDGAIRFYHQSVVDFLKDPARSKDLCVDLGKLNAEIARGCLDAMQAGLKFNICKLETSCCFNAEVKGLRNRISKMITRPLLYSCVHWISHVIRTGPGDQVSLMGNVEVFLREERPLYWLEVLSLVERMEVALLGLPELLKWLTSFREDLDARMRVVNLHMFTAAFYDAVSISTPHLYVSALALAPESAEVGQSWFPNRLMVICGGDRGWSDWLKVFSHGERMEACAISEDGQLVATSCGGNTVQLWDMKTAARIGEPLVGHSDLVTSVAFSPGGAFIVSGSGDKTVRLWDIKTRMPVHHPLGGHSDLVTSVAFSPDGTLIGSGSWDKTVRIWDVKTRIPVGHPLVGHSGWVTSVAFSPDGNLIVSGSSDKTVQMWDVKTHMPVGDPLVGHSGLVTSVAFSLDGAFVVSGSWDKTVRIWDVRTWMPIGDPLVGHLHWVTSVAFSPDATLIVSGSWDRAVRIWDVKTRTPVGEPLVGHSSLVTSVAFSPDGALIVSGSWDRAVRTWDVETRMPVGQPLVGHSSSVKSLALLPDATLVVSGSWDKTVQIWDAKTRMTAGDSLVGHSNTVTSVAFSPDSNLIVSGSSDKTVQMWDIKTRMPVGDPLVGHSGLVTSVAFSPNGNLVVSGSSDKTVRMWDVKTRMSVGDPLVGHSESVISVAFSPDGNLVVSGSHDKTVRMWDVKTRMPVGAPLVGHSNWVISVAFSPDGNLVASGSHDKTVRRWDVKNGMPVGHPLVGHSGSVTSVAFSPDGNLIVSGSSDKTVQMWDVKTRMPVDNPLVGHSRTVTSVAFSPDGNLVVSGSDDQTVRMWDVKTHMPVGHPLVGHSNWVTSVAFSPDGNLVASGSLDKKVRIWGVKTRRPVGDPLVGHSEWVTSVAFSPHGNLVVSGSVDWTVRMWDVKTRMPVGDPLVGHSGLVTSVAFSLDGDLIVSGSSDKTVRMWDVNTRMPVGDPLVGHSNTVTSVVFSPDGSLVVSGSSDKTVRMWDVKTHMPVGDPLVGHSRTVRSVAFSLDGNLIVSGSWDMTVRMWDIKTRMPVGDPLVGHSGWVMSVAFSPDGNLVVSGSYDKTVRIWDIKTRMSVGHRLVGHSDSVASVAVSPDGDLIVSGSVDRTVRMWDVKTRMPVGDPLVRHFSSVTSVAFSPDGNLIVSGSHDKTIRVSHNKTRLPAKSAKPLFSALVNTYQLRPLEGRDGWVTLDGQTPFLWLPAHYRRPSSPHTYQVFSADPASSTVTFDLSKFAYGTSWTSVACDAIRQDDM